MYVCVCASEPNDCFPEPCQNGGTCTDGDSSYTCSCLAGWTGTSCDAGTHLYLCSSTFEYTTYIRKHAVPNKHLDFRIFRKF